ncbi:MAG: DUF488 domain-containing protein [Fastidiosipilaceae bacterium]|jgi:uncharacterized protein YeaO (DUF488 family)
MAIQIKRIYNPFEQSDGVRLLVDRLWPRGISKEKARLDGWVKELAPSSDLRTWFGHEAEKFDEFSVRYQEELDTSAEAQEEVQEVLRQSEDNTVTLLYGAKDPQINHAVILKSYIESKAKN